MPLMILYLSQAYYFGDVGLVEFGFLLNTSIVIVVSLHLAIETLHWVNYHRDATLVKLS